MITPDQLRTLPIGTILHHLTCKGSDRQPMRCRTSGRLREWKRNPDGWEQPVKWGLKTSFTITAANAAEWELPQQ